VLGRFGQPGRSAGRLAFPNDVAVTADGSRLYVADTGNHRVQAWDIVPADALGDLDGEPGRGDASARVPYIAVAALALLAAIILIIVTVARWRREASGSEQPCEPEQD
ncbi:MAG: hypothetical protein ACYCX5_12735, partial [Coriobacteriia bacterium]